VSYEEKDMKTKDQAKERPANKATADQPAEEFIAPEGARAERGAGETKENGQQPLPRRSTARQDRP
jgi:hypothetical protein